jgi:hypothetical protein
MQATLHILDRENGLAIFEGEDKHRVPLPISAIPDELRVGDCVEIAILPDLEKLEALQTYATNLLNSVIKGDVSGLQMSKQDAYKNAILRELGNLTRPREGGFYLINLEHAAEAIAAALVGRGTK